MTCICTCGQPIPPRAGKTGPLPRWCSRLCRARRWSWPSFQERRTRLRRPEFRDQLCDGCGQRLPKMHKRWCSPLCRPVGYRPGVSHEKVCAWCSKRFTTTRSRKLTCSPGCSESRKRGRQYQYGSKLQKTVKRKILDRDGWRCYLCQRPIPKSKVWPHPLSGTVDHVMPWSAGGSDDPSNLRAAHWHCNEEKGDRLLGIEMGFTLEAA